MNFSINYYKNSKFESDSISITKEMEIPWILKDVDFPIVFSNNKKDYRIFNGYVYELSDDNLDLKILCQNEDELIVSKSIHNTKYKFKA